MSAVWGMKLVVSGLPRIRGCYTSPILGRLAKKGIYWPKYMNFCLFIKYCYGLITSPDGLELSHAGVRYVASPSLFGA